MKFDRRGFAFFWHCLIWSTMPSVIHPIDFQYEEQTDDHKENCQIIKTLIKGLALSILFFIRFLFSDLTEQVECSKR